MAGSCEWASRRHALPAAIPMTTNGFYISHVLTRDRGVQDTHDDNSRSQHELATCGVHDALTGSAASLADIAHPAIPGFENSRALDVVNA
jgi:hypothetical protein